MDGKWYTEEDFQRDFWSMAEISTTKGPQPEPPSSNHSTPKKKIKIKSIYVDSELTTPGADSDKEDDDVVVYCVPSRGRLMNPKLRRPGAKLPDKEFYKQLHSSIRQV